MVLCALHKLNYISKEILVDIVIQFYNCSVFVSRSFRLGFTIIFSIENIVLYELMQSTIPVFTGEQNELLQFK